jgi:hypothetical protein
MIVVLHCKTKETINVRKQHKFYGNKWVYASGKKRPQPKKRITRKQK